MMDSSSQVSDSLIPNVDSTACKIGDSNTDFSDTASLVSHFSMPQPISAPPYTVRDKTVHEIGEFVLIIVYLRI